MKLLFVCSGNTCRSAMCEVYFNHLCGTDGAADIADSCGGADRKEPLDILYEKLRSQEHKNNRS